MIARIFSASGSFHRVCRYVCQRQKTSEVLLAEGVREHDYRLMARDFETIHSLRELRSKPVFHGMIDFHPDEKPDDRKMVQIAREYLQEMGLVNTQYAVVKHTDTSHDHLHIVANRIDYEGELIQLYPEILRNKDVVEKLVQEHGLIPAVKKDLRHTNFDGLDASETRKYAIYRNLKECLPGCHDLQELEQRLLRQGIDTHFRLDSQTGEKIGISFRYQGEAFKGSNIDRDLSLKNIQSTLIQQQQITQWDNTKLVQRQQMIEQERRAKEEQAQQEQKLEQERQLTTGTGAATKAGA